MCSPLSGHRCQAQSGEGSAWLSFRTEEGKHAFGFRPKITQRQRRDANRSNVHLIQKGSAGRGRLKESCNARDCWISLTQKKTMRAVKLFLSCL